MSADGTGTRRVTNSELDDSHPTWSADGKLIVFSRGGSDLRQSVAGGPATRVLKNAAGAAADPRIRRTGS